METLQHCPSSNEPLPEALPRIHISYGSLKNRLQGIPKTPSIIIGPLPSLESESANPCSTATTATTTTEAASDADTAATSVFSLPQTFNIQKYHVSPSMPVDEKIQAVWIRQIKTRLSRVLYNNLPFGTCVQELIMAGKRPNALKPTLIITCGDALTRKEVEKTFKSQIWLQELLRANHIIFIALVAKTPLSAGLNSTDDSTVELSESYAIQLLPSRATTSCGLMVQINHVEGCLQQYCTLGGLIVVNGEILGLTARHPFFRTPPSGQELLKETEVVEDLNDGESTTNSEEIFVFNGHDDDDGTDGPSVLTVSLRENADALSTSTGGPLHGHHETLRPFRPLTNWHPRQTAIIPLHTPRHISSAEDLHHNHDWALLKTLPSAATSRPNKIAYVNPHCDVLIEGCISGLVCGEVTIIVAGIGPQSGSLLSSPGIMMVDGLILDVQLITLENVLPLGSSGAWVILEGKLCGYIIAIRQDIPWAYMVAIEPTLEDIGRKFKTNDVRLPTANEIESLTVSSKASNVDSSEKRGDILPSALEDDQVGEGLKPLGKIRGGRSPETQSSTIERKTPEPFVHSSKKKSHLSDQQENQSFHEKPQFTDDAPQTLQRIGSTTYKLVPVTNTYTPYSSLAKPVIAEQRYPWVLDPPSRRVRRYEEVQDSEAQSLLKRIIILPYKLWQNAETVILNIEYKRRQGWWRLYRSPPFLKHPKTDYSSDAKTAASRKLIFWYYLCLPLFVAVTILLHLLYFILCFPLIFWVAYRHRDVLQHAKSPEVPSSELPSSELPSSELPSSELPSSELPSSRPSPSHDYEYEQMNTNIY